MSPSAEAEVIKGAYDKLAKKYHPDHNRDTMANEKMKQLNIAYEVLGNANKRVEYHAKWEHMKRTATDNRGKPGEQSGGHHSANAHTPKVIITPKKIRFKDVSLSEKKRVGVDIKISGGQYERIRFDEKPIAWLEVTKQSEKRFEETTIVELILTATGLGTNGGNCWLPIEIVVGGRKIQKSVYTELVERPAGEPKFESTPPPSKPLLRVTPRQITFADMMPLGTKLMSFNVQNVGGPFTDYIVDTSQLLTWLEVTSIWRQTDQPLPVLVTLKATGQAVGKRYECELPVRIYHRSQGYYDEVKVHIDMIMRTPRLHIDGELIEFHLEDGRVCPAQSILIQNNGIGYIEGTALAREKWIKVSPQHIRFSDRQYIQVQVDSSYISNYDVGRIYVKTNAGQGLILVKVIVHNPKIQPQPAKNRDNVVRPNFFCPKCKIRSVGYNLKTNRFECIHHPKLHHWKKLSDFDK